MSPPSTAPLIEVFAAAHLAAIFAHARAYLASASLDDPAVVALVVLVTPDAVDIELQDEAGHAIGGFSV